MKRFTVLAALLLSLSFQVVAEEANEAMLFKGIIKQSHDYSCGSAALATLVAGTVTNSTLTEKEIIDTITAKTGEKETGYTASELAEASKKLGFDAEWRKVAPQKLAKITQPVILLIGINNKTPHYVVFKGIRDDQAYLADPIRGNVRVAYQELIEQGINAKYPAWYVMAIETSATAKPPHSTLYLSDDNASNLGSHLTEAQSGALILTTISRNSQVLVDYGFNAALGKTKVHGLSADTETFTHSFNTRYGISDDMEIGASLQYMENSLNLHAGDNNARISSDNRQYNVYANKRFKLDDFGKTNLLTGLSTSYAEQGDVFGASLNLTGYRNTEFGQWYAGVSFGKEFSTHALVSDALPDFTYSGLVGLAKPLGDRYLATVSFSVNDGQAKAGNSYAPSYSVSTSLNYLVSKQFQVAPSFGYTFGEHDQIFNVGVNIAYIGAW